MGIRAVNVNLAGDPMLDIESFICEKEQWIIDVIVKADPRY